MVRTVSGQLAYDHGWCDGGHPVGDRHCDESALCRALEHDGHPAGRCHDDPRDPACGTSFTHGDRRGCAALGYPDCLRVHCMGLSEIPWQSAVTYCRKSHIILREVGGPGQKALRDARVLVIGAGGLGAPALQYLAAAGIGTIGVIDDDIVENANLQRQIIHLDRNIGMPKVHSAAEAMTAQNPFVMTRPYHRRLTEDIASELFEDYELLLDGTDNYETRYLVNRIAVVQEKPLIAAALTQWEGQISLYDPVHGTPCYACVFPDAPDPALVPSCAEAGVIGPLPGVVGAMMAVEALKAITGAGAGLGGKLLIYDALYAQSRTISIKPRADCAACGGKGLHVGG